MIADSMDDTYTLVPRVTYSKQEASMMSSLKPSFSRVTVLKSASVDLSSNLLLGARPSLS